MPLQKIHYLNSSNKPVSFKLWLEETPGVNTTKYDQDLAPLEAKTRSIRGAPPFHHMIVSPPSVENTELDVAGTRTLNLRYPVDSPSNFKEITATVHPHGTHATVWVVTDADETITEEFILT